MSPISSFFGFDIAMFLEAFILLFGALAVSFVVTGVTDVVSAIR